MDNSDVLLEVLSRSSLETIGKCRLLSREINKLTYESMFEDLHRQRTKTISGYFLQTLLKNKFHWTFVSCDRSNITNTQVPLDFLPRFKKILASTKQGLMLCELVHERFPFGPQYVVCKPTTREWCRIPCPDSKLSTFSMAMIVLSINPLRYKIVRLSTYNEPTRQDQSYFYKNACEVFYSNPDVWKWKQLKDVDLFYSDFICIPPVTVCGRVHWLTRSRHILIFDAQTDTYAHRKLPKKLKITKDNLRLTDYGGKLGIIESGEDYMELWVLENYKNNIWKMRLKTNFEAFKKINENPSPLGFNTSDVALLKGIFGMFFYNLVNQKIDTVKLGNHVDESGVFRFVSDFEMCGLDRECC